MKPSFEILDHTADIGLRVWNDTGESLFVSAALGLSSILYGENVPSGGSEEQRIRVEAESLEDLLLYWLREILFRSEQDYVAYTAFQIEGSRFAPANTDKYFIYASLRGTKLKHIGHGICTEIKAVTRHGLSITREPAWEAVVLFDV